MTQVNNPTTGMERIGREALIILIETLNDELPAQDAYWADLDAELAELRELTDFEPITLELIDPQDFHLGHRPSLIKAPVERIPNVSVYADTSAEADINDMDQVAQTEVSLVVEIMVKSQTSEEEVNARAQRTTDAVNICLMSNRTLRGAVTDISDSPDVALSDVMVRSERTAYGDDWFWQMSRMEYVVQKAAVHPHGSFLRPASQPQPVIGSGIDQS